MRNTFDTARLSLTPLVKNDAQFILKLVNTEEWLRFIGERNVRSLDDSVNYIHKILNSENVRYFVVRIRGNNVAAGIITVIKRDYLEHEDIGFAFLPEFTGSGYAYEAAKVVLDEMKEGGADEVLATTNRENINSIRLLTKLNFILSGEINVNEKELLLFSLNNTTNC